MTTTEIRPHGVVDMPEPDYHADPALSASGAKLLVPPSVPAIYRWRMDHPVTSDAFDTGHAAHMLILGTGDPIARIEADDWRTKAAREARDAARAEHQTPLLAAEHDRVLAMAEAVRTDPTAGRIFDPERGQAERSLFWTDDETGVQRRARLDWLPNPSTGRLIIADLKTCRSANPATFGKAAADFGYFMQHPWYCDAVEACGLTDPGDAAFVFVLVEKEPPHLVSVVELDPDAVRLGRNLNRRALATFADCARTDTWPGYGDDVHSVSLPAWFTRSHEGDMY